MSGFTQNVRFRKYLTELQKHFQSELHRYFFCRDNMTSNQSLTHPQMTACCRTYRPWILPGQTKTHLSVADGLPVEAL